MCQYSSQIFEKDTCSTHTILAFGLDSVAIFVGQRIEHEGFLHVDERFERSFIASPGGVIYHQMVRFFIPANDSPLTDTAGHPG